MTPYKTGSAVLPVLLLFWLATLAAYPWVFPDICAVLRDGSLSPLAARNAVRGAGAATGDGLVLPFVGSLTVLFCALRYPGLLPAPMVFLAGIAFDLFTNAPLGLWTFIMLVTLGMGRSWHYLWGRLGGLACSPFF